VVSDDKIERGGYIDHQGKLQLPLRFESACPFSGGVAKVVLNGRWVFIDKTGKVLFDALVTRCQTFTDGRVIAPEGSRWGYLDRSGKFAIPARFTKANAFHQGRAFVVEDLKLKLIDLQGTEISQLQSVEQTEDFEQGLARVKVGGKWGLVDTGGRMATPPEYESIEPVVSGLRVAKRPGQARGADFLDPQGRIVKPPLPVCADYRAGVFTCLDEKATEANSRGAGFGLNIVYITRSGQRIGGIGLSTGK
jgi:hypothetical protein